MSRTERLQALSSQTFDVLVLGGGINGAVAAAALAARGLQVALVERDDFGSATSANSSCLVWGGIKYLESGEWHLVRELCQSRNRLMHCFPHAIREIRFLASVPAVFRKPAWMLYAGAWLYWLMGDGVTRIPRLWSARALQQADPLLRQGQVAGVEYSDAWLVDSDSRFTFGFIRSAADSGAVTLNYCEALDSHKTPQGWQTRVHDRRGGGEQAVHSRFLINACGPWLDNYRQQSGLPSDYRHRFSRGIHLLVPRLSAVERVLAFFASDGRLFFAIPMGSCTCIGTTDIEVDSPDSRVTAAERQFVLDNINRHLALEKPLTPDDVISERSGVRPLVVAAQHASAGLSNTEWQTLSRRHQLYSGDGWLAIYGGKLTDCLNVGDEVCVELQRQGLVMGAERPGWLGEPPALEYEVFCRAADDAGLNRAGRAGSEPLSQRLWRRYGRRAMEILAWGQADPRWWQPLLEGDDLLRAEVRLAARDEMVETLEDFLRRRTLLALTHGRAALLADPGLPVLARLLFGAAADQRLQEYRNTPATPVTDKA